VLRRTTSVSRISRLHLTRPPLSSATPPARAIKRNCTPGLFPRLPGSVDVLSLSLSLGREALPPPSRNRSQFERAIWKLQSRFRRARIGATTRERRLSPPPPKLLAPFVHLTRERVGSSRSDSPSCRCADLNIYSPAERGRRLSFQSALGLRVCRKTITGHSPAILQLTAPSAGRVG